MVEDMRSSSPDIRPLGWRAVGRVRADLGGLVALGLLVACNGKAPGDTGSSASATGQVAPSQTTAPSVPPTGPAALGAPRAFHFVVPTTDKPNAVVLLDAENSVASAKWVRQGVAIDSLSLGPGRGHTAGILADDAKLPASLRLRGVTVHLYADDNLLCDGTLSNARVGAVGDEGAVAAYSDATRDVSTLLGAGVTRVLLFEIDVPPACAARFKNERARIAWARDASLPAPNVVGKAEPVVSATPSDLAREALKLARARPSFASSQKSLDTARKVVHLGPEPLETVMRATWTHFSWNGEKRGYLAIVEECPPPLVQLGIDFRERDDGALELREDRAMADVSKRSVVDPVVLVDVDADGQLEAIEAGNSYRLESFEGAEVYAVLPIDHCT